jgi:hypothetical protein
MGRLPLLGRSSSAPLTLSWRQALPRRRPRPAQTVAVFLPEPSSCFLCHSFSTLGKKKLIHAVLLLTQYGGMYENFQTFITYQNHVFFGLLCIEVLITFAAFGIKNFVVVPFHWLDVGLQECIPCIDSSTHASWTRHAS